MKAEQIIEFFDSLTPGKNIIVVTHTLCGVAITCYGVFQRFCREIGHFTISTEKREMSIIYFENVSEIAEIPLEAVANFLNEQKNATNSLSRARFSLHAQ